ncbi:MAG: hypothetical protein QOJ00_81 [Actinomycetota bacterium]|jgi:uncharacterized membrane protein YdbT with pleckstrin-like domain
MAFPEKLMNDGEELIIDTHPHWWVFSGVGLRLVLAIVIAVIAATKIHDQPVVNFVGIALILAAVVNLAIVYVKWRTTDFVLTSDRLVTRSGVLSRQTREIPLERINDLACHQSLFERVIHAGDLMIESAGERGQEVFPNVADPFAVQNLIHRAMEGATAVKPVNAADSIPEQIEKLDELRQRGVISQAEFEDKKRRLLDRL